MTKSPIEMMLDNVTWTPIEGETEPCGIPIATHSGVLEFASMSLRVYQLSDGQRVIHEDDMAAFVSHLSGYRSHFTPAQNEWLDLFS